MSQLDQIMMDDKMVDVQVEYSIEGRYLNEYHIPLVLLLDCSWSLEGRPIDELNRGLQSFKKQIENYDHKSRSCIDISVISFGGCVDGDEDFYPIGNYIPKVYSARGNTPMGEALTKAMDLVEYQKERYKDHSVPYHRPWIFLITDGVPTDEYKEAAKRLREMEAQKGVLAYCVGTEGYDRVTMGEIFNHQRIFKLESLDFTGMFEFLSNSIVTVRLSDPTCNTAIEVVAPHTLTMGA